MNLDKLSAYEIGSLVNNKKIKAIDVIDFFIDLINKKNKEINAFVYLKMDEARKKALEIDEKILKGEYVGPFAGVPFALKDFLDSKKGWTNSRGGVKSLISVDKYDSIFTESMEKLGAIAIGKCNAPTFGFSGTTDNKLYGPTHNPFNYEYNSGGSSGGSAAAVASLMVPVAEGGDAGGSIRIPASWCNCFGFKASVGTVANICEEDIYSATHPFCMGGGITRSVLDSAILLNEMAHFDNRDPYSVNKKVDYVKELDKKVKGLKVGYTLDYDLYPVDKEIKEVILKRINELRKLGIEIEEVHFSFKKKLKEYSEIWKTFISIDTAYELKDKLDLLEDELPKEFIKYNKKAAKIGLNDYKEYNLIKSEIYNEFRKIFDKYDLIISPVTACLPVKNNKNDLTYGPKEIEGIEIDPLIDYSMCFLINFIGYPSCSIPCSFSKSGLPIGMQIIADRYKDELIFTLSKKIEDSFPWKDSYK